jgi:disulfide oxidoreductase YuzD
MSRNVKYKWLAAPNAHDYPAALSYLNLIYPDRTARRFVAALKVAPVKQFKAKDMFRAARLKLLGPGNSHVEKDVEKIRAGERLSPLLLVRDTVNGHVVIADGYHRLCAVYSFDEDALIPCKIV